MPDANEVQRLTNRIFFYGCLEALRATVVNSGEVALAKTTDDIKSNILWINRAHALAAKKFQLAVEKFEAAHEVSKAGIDKFR